MGLVDVFSPEDKVEVTKSELFSFMLSQAKNDLLINGLRNGVSNEDLLKVLDVEVNKSES